MRHQLKPSPISPGTQRILRSLLYHILGTALGILPFVCVYGFSVYVVGVDFESGHRGFKAFMIFLISVGLLWWMILRLIHNPTFMKLSQWLEK